MTIDSKATLIDQIDALLSLDAKGALVPHGIGGLARDLLLACRDRLETHPSPKVEGSPARAIVDLAAAVILANIVTTEREAKWVAGRIIELVEASDGRAMDIIRRAAEHLEASPSPVLADEGVAVTDEMVEAAIKAADKVYSVMPVERGELPSVFEKRVFRAAIEAVLRPPAVTP